jgi:hypothetical protein
MLGRDAIVLFRRGPTIYKYGVIIAKTENEALALSLWGKDADGETWSTIYFFCRVKDIKDKEFPAARINTLLNRSPKDNWQGLVVLSIKDSEQVQAFFRKQLEGL